VKEYSRLPALIDYLSRSTSAFHAASNAAALLDAAGFTALDEADSWNLASGGAHYVVRNGSALVAFVVGENPPAEAGFALVGAHTDSPALRVRLAAETLSRNVGRVGIDIYGAPIVSGWLDRELAVAGRVAAAADGGAVRSILVDSARPVALVPNVAIHLNRDVNKGYEYDPQTKLAALVSACPEGEARAGFRDLIASLAAVDPAALGGADLFLYDPTPPRRFGLDGELVAAGRVDNLAGCHASLAALAESRAALPLRASTRVIALFDNEEVGSRSYQGADSSFLRRILDRISVLRSPGGNPAEAYPRAAARSFMVSVDAAHAFHPSWAEKYDEATTPLLNRGLVVKNNGRMRYATDAESAARFEALCRRVGAPSQRFEFRADQTPGSTIGPMASADLGIRAVDVGLPILAMHSIRETFGAADQESMVAALEGHLSGR
jgi:aspartyl aminopeptidase